MLVVLVALNGDGGQGGVALNALGFPQVAVTGGKAAVEQFQNINLTAGGGQGIEVKVMDVDVAFPVSLGMFRAEQIHLVISLGTGSADLQHGAHGGVAVDVGVVPLHVADPGIGVGDFIDGFHQAGVGLSGPGTIGPVEDVGLGSGAEAMVHQLAFHGILNGFDVGSFGGKMGFQFPLHIIGYSGGIRCIAVLGGFHGAQNGGGNLVLVKQDHSAISLDNAGNHRQKSCLSEEIGGAKR